jgi:hypothetical protein
MENKENQTAIKDYQVEVERLKLFNARWNSFINKTVQNYPSDQTRKLLSLSNTITEILMKEDAEFYTAKDKIEDIYKLIDKEGDLTANQRPSLFGKSDNGFDMEEVLNPKEKLDLKTLLDELGVTK